MRIYIRVMWALISFTIALGLTAEGVGASAPLPVSVVALPSNELNTPVPTLTPILTPVPPFSLFTPIVGSCSGSGVVGFGTVTPDLLWLAACGQCMPTYTAVPTWTHVTNTPRVGSGELTGAPGTSTPCVGCTETPTPTNTSAPTFTPTPTQSLFLLSGTCYGGNSCEQLGTNYFHITRVSADRDFDTGWVQGFYASVAGTVYMRFKQGVVDWEHYTPVEPDWYTTLGFGSEGGGNKTVERFAPGQSCYNDSSRCGVTIDMDELHSQTKLEQGGFEVAINDYSGWTQKVPKVGAEFWVSLDPIPANTPTPSPTGTAITPVGYCGSVNNGGQSSTDTSSVASVSVGNIITQTCYTTPGVSLREVVENATAFINLWVTDLDWLYDFFVGELQPVTICLRGRDFSLYIFRVRIPVVEFVLLGMFLTSLNYWVSLASTLGHFSGGQGRR